MSRIDWREALIKKANSQLKGGMHHEIDKNTRKIAGERKNFTSGFYYTDGGIGSDGNLVAVAF